MKLICPCPEYFSEKIKKIFSKKYKCLFKKMNNDEFNKVCHNYDIILIRFNSIIKYKQNTNIKFILSPTTGIEHIDTKFFNDKKIKVITLRNKIKFLKNIRATVEFTIFLILFYLRQTGLNIVNKNKFKNKILQEEIYNKKIGIIGFGRIGKKVHQILSSFNASLKIYEKKKFKSSKKFNFVGLNNLLKTCKIILIHIPLDLKNKNFLNNSKLKLLKKGTVVINTSRGNVLDEGYIFSLVKKKKISYFTDVISSELLLNRQKLIKKMQNNENFYYSNHVAGLTKESVEKTDLFIYKNFTNNFKSN
tara:strand:- start:11520 stop:12434 length:915 start_codon:yes stop_codon:yes gene_type:complete